MHPSTCTPLSKHWPPALRSRAASTPSCQRKVVPSPLTLAFPAWAGDHYASRAGVSGLTRLPVPTSRRKSLQATPAVLLIRENGPAPDSGPGLASSSQPAQPEHQVSTGDVRLPPPSFITGAPACLGRGVLAGHGCPSPPRPDSPPLRSPSPSGSQWKRNPCALHTEKGAQIRVMAGVSRRRHLC